MVATARRVGVGRRRRDHSGTLGEVPGRRSGRAAPLARCLARQGIAEAPRGACGRLRVQAGIGGKLGTSVRFLFPTSPATHERFKSLLASMPKGAFIERPMGAYAPEEQARDLMEVAAAARAAGLDGLLTGDSHGANPGYAAAFSPLPTLARLMSVTGDMPVGVVLLAPFYHPVLLAEQIGT